MTRRTLVLGLGNDILRDDGVGLAAARRVAAAVGGDADVRETCVATVDLLFVLSGYDRVIVVDAYEDPLTPPGTAIRCVPEQLPRGFGFRSPHTIPFSEMLAFGRSLGLPMPREVVIHGLCVDDTRTFGSGFTSDVERSWRDWADAIVAAEFGRRPEPATARG